MTIKEILHDFSYHLIYNKAMSLSSSKVYLAEVERLLLCIDLKNLNNEVLEEHLKRKDITPRTLCRIISTYRSFDKFCNKKYNTKRFADNLSLPKLGLVLPKDLDIEVVEELLGSMDISIPQELRDKALFETIYSTGIRVSEAINIKLSDIDFINKTIKVVGKGDKQRIVVIGDTAISILKQYIIEFRQVHKIKTDNTLFITRRGKKMSRINAYKRLQIYAKRINLDKASVHSLRHSFATHMLRNNSDLLVVSELLGHSSVQTTEIYTHLNTDDLQESYEKAFELIFD